MKAEGRNFSHCEIERYWSMVKEESEQGLQYKVYTREATDKNAEKSAQVLGESSGTNSAVPQPRNERQPLCCLFLFFPVNRVLHHQFLDESNIQDLKYKWYNGTLVHCDKQ